MQERYEYDPYGVTTVLTPAFSPRATSAFAWETTYCGYRWEDAVGLFAVRYRWYSPRLATWVSRDPIGYAAGVNLYAYVGRRPIDSVDPWGLQDWILPMGSRGFPTSEQGTAQPPAITVSVTPQMASRLVIVEDGTHSWVEFDDDLSNYGFTGPLPVKVRAEMTGPGYGNPGAAFFGTTGEIEVRIWPNYPGQENPLPKCSSDSKRVREFSGNPRNLVQWIDRQTVEPFAASVVSTFSGRQENGPALFVMTGKGSFGTYGVPRTPGREHCATFAATATCAFTSQPWMDLFPYDKSKTAPGNLMFGPPGLFTLPQDLSLPPKGEEDR